MKKFAIVILNWNGKDLLEKYLPFLLKYTDTTIADIVIADNHSTDGSIEFLKTNYPNLSLIILPENYGFAEGYNKALAQVEAEYYVLLNSDVEVTENWLAPLTDFLDKNADTACVQPKILAERNKEYFEYAGACGGFIDKYGYPFCRGRIFATVENDEQQYNNPLQIFWATGACMVIRSKDFKDAGGFDGTFFAHMEEIDLCWRLNARGRKIYCIPQSVVYHVGGATLSKESPRKTFLNFRNNMLMLYKNLGYENFKRLFYTRISLDYLAASQMILTGSFQNAKAVIQARREFKKIRKNYKQTRKENLVRQTIKNIDTIYPKSLLWQYYIKGKKRFDQLNWRNKYI